MKVDTLTKEQILQLIKDSGGWMPANATVFYHNGVNFIRLLQLSSEEKIRSRDTKAFAFELIE